MSVRKFKIIRDLEYGEDGEVVSLYDEKQCLILTGDWYHDKIDSKIDGFFEALIYMGMQHDVETQRINVDE